MTNHLSTCRTCGQEQSRDACTACSDADVRPGDDFAASRAGSLEETIAHTPILPEGCGPSIFPGPGIRLREITPGGTPGQAIPVDGTADDASVRYVIGGELGRGGMGRVLKGRDPDLGRDVAIKVLGEDLSDNPIMVRRFVEEAQIGGQLQHPGVVPVHELGVFADGRPFFTMRLVRGRTLAASLAERPSPGVDLPRLLAIFEQVAQAMAYAHARGVIHRDLKPSNVMVGAFGEVQVMDWGLAKVIHPGESAPGIPGAGESFVSTLPCSSDDPGLSLPGSVLGTPSYMAPEQARGAPEALDERADVFSLGSILCEILTGAPAFTGRTATEIHAKAAAGDTADALARMAGCGADPELVGLARDCLALGPADRPPGAAGVSGRIMAYRSGVQDRLRTAEMRRAAEAARAEEAIARAKVERDRRRLTIALAATVLLSVALAGVAATWNARRLSLRTATAARALAEALGEAKLRHAIAKDAESGDLEGWIKAVESARRVEGLLADDSLGEADRVGARAVTAPILDEGRAAEARIAADRDDRRMVGRLSEIRLGITSGDNSRTDAEFASAFAEYGIDVDKMSPQDAGDRIRARAIQAELVSVLDEWIFARRATGKEGQRRLVAVADVADPDPWRIRLRGALLDDDVEALVQLARSINLEDAPKLGAQRLAFALCESGKRDAGIALFLSLQRKYPDDFWINWDLSRNLHESGPDGKEGTLRFASVALALRPENPLARSHYAYVLKERGEALGAIHEFREAVRLKPDFLWARSQLLGLLRDAGRAEELGREIRDAGRLDFEDPGLLIGLAQLLAEAGDLDTSIAKYRGAVALAPSNIEARGGLAGVYARKGDHDRAIAELREVIRLQPGLVIAHEDLGLSLEAKGDEAAAVAEYRRVIELDPQNKHALDRLAELTSAGPPR